MTRTLAKVGIAVLAVAGSAMVTQAQAPNDTIETLETFGVDAQRPQVVQRGQRGGNRGLGNVQRRGFQRGQVNRFRGAQAGQFIGRRGGAQGRRGGGPGALRGLDLTDDQKAQVKAIHEQAQKDVEAMLTPEQLEKMKSREGRGGRGGGRGPGDQGGGDRGQQ